jgi:hypothetical protein
MIYLFRRSIALLTVAVTVAPFAAADASAAGAECGRLSARITQLQKSLARLRSELGGGFGTTPEYWAKNARGPQLMSEIRRTEANLKKTIALRTEKKCPD